MLKALHLDDPEARHMQLSRPVRVDLNVQFLSVLTQQVSEKQHFVNLYLHLYNTWGAIHIYNDIQSITKKQ